MHIFLTGAIGVGKSTILNHIEQQIDVKKGGFRTIGDRDRIEKPTYVYIYDAGKGENAKGTAVAHRFGNGGFKANPDVFDTVGVEYLENGKEADLIIMDELGFMENEAHLFQKKVFEILDGTIPVLGVVKDRDTQFLNKVREHEKVKVFEITLQNRDKIKKEIFECFVGHKNL